MVAKSYTLAIYIFFTNFGNGRDLYIDSHLAEGLKNFGYLENCPWPVYFGKSPKPCGLYGKVDLSTGSKAL